MFAKDVTVLIALVEMGLVHKSNADATSLTEGSEFYGFQLEEAGYLDSRGLPASCINALTQMIYCDAYVYDFGGEPRWRGYVDTNETTYESVCDASCGASIRSYWDGIVEECAGHNFSSNTTITIGAGRLWEAWNETCYYDPDSGRNCNEIINDFAEVDDIEHMPYDEICSYCQVEHYRMMQNSPYSAYDEFFQRELQKINEKCGLDIPTDISFPPEPPRALDLGCFYEAYKIQEGDTCASVAEKYNLTAEDIRASYAMRYAAEKWPADCDNFRAGLVVCIPRAAGEDEAALADGELSSSADVEPSISPLTSTPQVSSSSTKTASTTGIPVNSSQSTGIISMATSESSGTIGAKPATQTAGSSADATPSVSVDHVSAASMIGFGRSQIIAVAAALMLCHITVCGPAARWIEGAQLAREIGCTCRGCVPKKHCPRFHKCWGSCRHSGSFSPSTIAIICYAISYCRVVAPFHKPSFSSFICSSSPCRCATALLKALTTSSGTVSQSKLLVYTSAALGPLASRILPSVSARLGRRLAEAGAEAMVSMYC
ncbi:hypothetical protein KCU62_g111, partial [Aureobasidium sp. EXF-3399]